MKTAILLCTMGGPDSLKAVRPFLFNLFYDPAILRFSNPKRWLLAHIISMARASAAKAIYEKLGGRSPLLENTRAQAQALETVLSAHGDFRCFVGMSYCHPFIGEAMREIQAYQAEHLIVLPLYPQFSTTTSQSVFRDVDLFLRRENRIKKINGMPACAGMTVFVATCNNIKQWFSIPHNSKTVSCQRRLASHLLFIRSRSEPREIRLSRVESFPTLEGFIAAMHDPLRRAYDEAQEYGKPRVLFSAHGLPESIVKDGDPYPQQCEETVKALLDAWQGPELDTVLCYQSKVGRMAWIGPSMESEVIKAATAKRPIIVVPIAFVSEHSETLVELAIETKALAQSWGSPFFKVVATAGINPVFIRGLADLILEINQNAQKTNEFSQKMAG